MYVGVAGVHFSTTRFQTVCSLQACNLQRSCLEPRPEQMDLLLSFLKATRGSSLVGLEETSHPATVLLPAILRFFYSKSETSTCNISTFSFGLVQDVHFAAD